jgi:hypothetical protein
METTDHSVERAQQALSSSTRSPMPVRPVSVPNQRPGEAAITIDIGFAGLGISGLCRARAARRCPSGEQAAHCWGKLLGETALCAGNRLN